VVPTTDTELEALAANRERFQKVGTRVAISSLDVVRLARSKLETARTLRKHKIPTPLTATLEEFLSAPASWRWPLILKPIAGSSSIGVHIVDSPEALRHLCIDPARYVAQELSKGTEYTVNIYFDSTGEVRCAVPHARIETRGGEVSKGMTERHPVLMALAEQVGVVLRGQAYGALCFQAILTPQGEAMVFEINARFGGGYPLAHRAGAPFSRWLLEDALGLPCSAHNNWQEHLVMLRYDAAFFLERKLAG
jgi:carbamoyl-phosphate synthase large subunit